MARVKEKAYQGVQHNKRPAILEFVQYSLLYRRIKDMGKETKKWRAQNSGTN
jgi:hypothetical protein